MRRIYFFVLCGLLSFSVAMSDSLDPPESPTTGPTAPGGMNSATGGDLTQKMQQDTAIALKTFEGVSDKKYSNDKESFFNSGDSAYGNGDKQRRFKIENTGKNSTPAPWVEQ